MLRSDFDRFSELLDAVCGMLSRSTYAPSSANTALWFRALAEHDLASVRAAFDAHVKDPQRGRFVPTPADIIAQISGAASDDGRPGAEEAWAVALSASDESRTVVWTQEASLAWGICRPVLEAGDKVGARMAFKEAYTRLVDAARGRCEPAEWSVSIGFDAQQRDAAIEQAQTAGLLKGTPVVALPAPEGFAPLLRNDQMPAGVREKLLALRESFAARLGGEFIDDTDRQRTAELKARAAERVAAYTGEKA